MQDVVDAADEFPAVLAELEEWMCHRELGTKYSYAFVTDGYVLVTLCFREGGDKSRPTREKCPRK